MAPKKRKLYDQDNLLKAIADIKNGMKYKEASVKYGIPTSTLNDKINNKYSIERSQIIDQSYP